MGRLPEPLGFDQSDGEVQQAIKALNDGKAADDVARRLLDQGWSQNGVRRMLATLSEVEEQQEKPESWGSDFRVPTGPQPMNVEMRTGALLIVIGLLVTLASYMYATTTPGILKYSIAWGAVAAGLYQYGRGVQRYRGSGVPIGLWKFIAALILGAAVIVVGYSIHGVL
jgi:hypothetical protein